MNKINTVEGYRLEFKTQNSKLKIVLLALLCCNSLFAQTKYPIAVENVLQKAKGNRVELEKALNYFYKQKDTLKIKAINFLVTNMEGHYSADYYWADSAGNKISFNELSYPDFKAAIHAFDSLKQAVGKIHPVATTYKDIDTIKGNYLIENVESAFTEWKSPTGSHTGFADFCEYILPYRISVEPLQDWRKRYEATFEWLADSLQKSNGDGVAKFLINDINKWFTCQYDFEKRTEPLPRLGALQVLLRKKGYCEDVADLSVFALRAQGIAASTDEIPFWATSSGGHMLNFTEKEDGKKTRFDVLFNYANMSIDSFQLMREPGKVFRQTFSVQPSALPNRLDTGNIPHGVLQSRYIKDVTDEYWQTGSFSATLKPSMLPSGSIVYACVLNYQRWQPIWWSAKTNTNKVTYTNMCKGVVYLPQYYTNHHLVPAAYPVAFGYKGMKELKPDNIHKSTVEIKEQEHYLLFQTGKKYQLYYWDNNWKLAGIKTAAEKATSLSFENVPKNALLILVPEYSKGKDRPFVMQEDGSREWF